MKNNEREGTKEIHNYFYICQQLIVRRYYTTSNCSFLRVIALFEFTPALEVPPLSN